MHIHVNSCTTTILATNVQGDGPNMRKLTNMQELLMCGGDINMWELLMYGGDINVQDLLYSHVVKHVQKHVGKCVGTMCVKMCVKTCGSYSHVR